jgi:hypothetical protein
VRRIALMTGAIAALVVAGLSLNTANAAPRTVQGSVQGSVVSLVAATRTIATAEREEVARAARAATAAKTASEPAEKTEVAAKPAAPKFVVSAGCQQAINNLKSLRQADVSEDASERTGAPETAESDQAKDAAELQSWSTALMAARTVCLPQPAAACAQQIHSLQEIVQTTGTEELAEVQAATRDKSDQVADWIKIRAAFSGVPFACANSD